MQELKTALKWLVIATIFITPFIAFIVPSSLFFPFITGKNFTFRILVEIMVAAWAVLAFMDIRYRPRFSHILAAASIFLGVITLADLLGENPYRSFWSNYERMEGLVTHAHLFLYFLVASSVMLSERVWIWFFRTSLFASLLINWDALSQLRGKEAIHQSSDRLDASLGNSTYLAVYSLFHIWLGIYFFFRDRQNSVRWLYLVPAFTNLIIMYYTQTRGAMVGLIGGVFLTLLLIALFEKNEQGARRFRKYAIAGITAVILLVGIFVTFKHSAFVQEHTTLKRLADISFTDNTVKSRFLIWGMSYQGFKERPILGWGQDNFIYVFGKHFDPRMWAQEPWFDRSHNVFFDWLIAAGSLGLLSYLGLFGSVIYLIWFSKHSDFTIMEKSILTGMLGAYFAQNLFVFDNLTSYILFFGVMGYVHANHVRNSNPSRKDAEEKEQTPEAVYAVSAVAAILLCFVVYSANITNINNNQSLITSLRGDDKITKDKDGKLVIPLEQVIARGGFGAAEAREQLGQMALYAQGSQGVDQTVRQAMYDTAEREIKAELERDPNNLRTTFFLGAFYEKFGKFDQAQALLEKAINLSPRRQLTWIEYGILHLNKGNIPAAKEAFQKAYELDTQYPEARIFYIISLLAIGDNTKADELMTGLNGAERWDNRLVLGLARSQRYDRIIEVLGQKIAEGDVDARTYYAIGGAYNELKQKDKAIENIQKGVELTTDADTKKEGETMIAEIKSGKSTAR